MGDRKATHKHKMGLDIYKKDPGQNNTLLTILNGATEPRDNATWKKALHGLESMEYRISLASMFYMHSCAACKMPQCCSICAA